MCARIRRSIASGGGATPRSGPGRARLVRRNPGTHLRDQPGMGFFVRPRVLATEEPQVTTSLFDIAADLDTPVSAYLKLKPFRPRFLLESVEGGERLARYSFIGFGDCLEFRLDASGLRIGAD